MKSNRLAVFLIAMGVSLSASAQLTQGDIPDNTRTPANRITPDDCVLLSQNIDFTLSSNVGAAWACSQTTGTMSAGACSTAGATRTRTIPCSRRTVQVGGVDTVVKNVAACPDQPPAQNDNATITGRIFYFGNSGGGQVNPSPLGDGTTLCTSANIRAAFEWPTE